MRTRLSNRLRNGDFEVSAERLVGWRWRAENSASWRLMSGQVGRAGRCLRIDLLAGGSRATLSQKVRCKSGQLYRLELVGRIADRSELIVAGRARWLDDRQRVVGQLELRLPCRGRGWALSRRCQRAPAGARRLLVELTVSGGPGRCYIGAVRLVPADEPDAMSHALALPPLPLAYRPPRLVRTVAIIGHEGAGSKLTGDLGRVFGRKNVWQVDAARLGRGWPEADAVLIECEHLPAGLSLARLLEVSRRQVVVVSLSGFAAAVNARRAGLAQTRLVRQQCSPPHARVEQAGFITRGFALQDVIPYWFEPDMSGWFCQRQLRATSVLKRFLQGYGLVTVLTSQAEYDAASGQPLVLCRTRQGGALVVMDLAAACGPAGAEQRELALLLLLNALGRDQVGLGQYVVPGRDSSELRDELAELVRRFDGLELIGGSGQPMVRLGWAGAWGASSAEAARRVLIRTSGQGDDWPAFYGTLLVLKRLAQEVSLQTAYGCTILRNVQIAWAGLSGSDWPERLRPEADVVIELGCGRRERARLLVRRGRTMLRRCQTSLPYLARTLVATPVEVQADWASGARTPSGRAKRGTTWLSLILPGPVGSGPHCSVRQTDQAALLLEQVLGLQFGLVVVNRGSVVRRLCCPVIVNRRARMRVVSADEVVLVERRVEPGRRLIRAALPSGARLLLGPR